MEVFGGVGEGAGEVGVGGGVAGAADGPGQDAAGGGVVVQADEHFRCGADEAVDGEDPGVGVAVGELGE